MSHYLNMFLRRWNSLSAGKIRRLGPLWTALILFGFALAFFVPLKRYLRAHPGFRSSRAYYSVHVETDGLVHPVHLTCPNGEEGRFDLLVVSNLSTQYPLALMAFTTRPDTSSEPQEQMVSWAKWIIDERQVIEVPPGHAWVLKPTDHEHLLSVHGHTWLALFYDPLRSRNGPISPTVSPSYRGAFDLYYRPSGLLSKHAANPILWTADITSLLGREADLSNSVMYAANALDLRGHDGLNQRELQP